MVIEKITKKGNTAAVIKEREMVWQTVADRLNAYVGLLNLNLKLSQEINAISPKRSQ